jgi:hypothetical protein
VYGSLTDAGCGVPRTVVSLSVGTSDNCATCTRLWREYAEATTQHVAMDSALRDAALDHNISAIESLTRAVEALGALRSEARDAIRQHEAEAHQASGSGRVQ